MSSRSDIVKLKRAYELRTGPEDKQKVKVDPLVAKEVSVTISRRSDAKLVDRGLSTEWRRTVHDLGAGIGVWSGRMRWNTVKSAEEDRYQIDACQFLSKGKSSWKLHPK